MQDMTKQNGVAGARVPGGPDGDAGDFGFHVWNLEVHETLKTVIDKMIAEALEHATADYQASARILRPFEALDAVTMRVTLPLGTGDDDDSNPAWDVAFVDLLKNYVEDLDTVESNHERAAALAVAAALRKAADAIEARVAKLSVSK